MLETILVPILMAQAALAPADSSRPARAAAPAETTVVVLPAVEVRALLHDMESSETVHVVTTTTLRSFPLDRLADALLLQPGVVAVGEELHVRGGRSGELAVALEGIDLNEPLRRRPMDVPLIALRSVDLISGAPEARYGGGLAGVLDLHTVDPGDRLSAEWRWQTDGRTGTHYDRVAGRAGAPLRFLGLGLVAAGEATLDDTGQPMLRTVSRREILGMSFGWRAENRIFGFAKLASVAHPERFTAQVLVNRQVHEPYNPSFSVDGWMDVPANLKVTPTYSPTPQPGYLRYRAADRMAITDDRQIATLVRIANPDPRRHGSVTLGWMRTATVTSVGGGREPESASHRPRYGSPIDQDRYYVLWGDYPLYRESDTDVLTARGDGELATRTGAITAGLGVTHDDVSMREMDWMPFASRAGDEGFPPPLDSIRTYAAKAPGGFGYVQGRWHSGGMALSLGLRGEYFTAGPEGARQTLPGSGRGVWSFAPRLGIAYPISVRDVFSLAYVRVQQSPGRDFLYDRRTAISDRQPLGNPALAPATLISYEASVKHLFGPEWAFQTSLYYRDVFGQVGAVDAAIPEGPMNLRYLDTDQSHAFGFELSVLRDAGELRRIEARYTWMNAWGNESRSEGDPYGPVRSARTPPLGDTPVSWDRRHTFLVSGVWDWRRRWSVSWSAALLSPLPWTPKPARQPFTDLGLVNSRRLGWTENTNVGLAWSPPHAAGITLGLEARNLFNDRTQQAATLDGYPNPVINTIYDDYGAYRTLTGADGGGYWSIANHAWIPAHDPRLYGPPRSVRASVGARW